MNLIVRPVAKRLHRLTPSRDWLLRFCVECETIKEASEPTP